jgi:predicted membrane protein
VVNSSTDWSRSGTTLIWRRILARLSGAVIYRLPTTVHRHFDGRLLLVTYVRAVQVMEQRIAQVSPTRLIVGLFFAATGVILTADNLGWLDADDYLRFWPVLLMVIGAYKLFTGASRVVAVILIVVGAWILAYNLGVIRFTIFDLWPLVLIGIGVGLVARAVGFSPERAAVQFARGENVAILNARRVTNSSPDFRGGSIVAILGGYELDLTGARIADSPVIIDTTAIMGGIEIFVPDDWEVVGEVTPVMAGYDARLGAKTDPKKRLIVRGAAIMGGVEVKSASRRTSS